MPTLVKPSSLLPQGIELRQVGQYKLFKFSDQLGARLQSLLDKKKADTLTTTESLELEMIAELDDIFSYINAVMATEV